MAWSEFPGAAVGGAGGGARRGRVAGGAVAPLGGVCGRAGGAGVAYWWLTRWTQAVNVEALAGLLAAPAPAPVRIEILAEPEPAPEPALEAAAQIFAEPVPAAADLAEAPEPEVVEGVVAEFEPVQTV